MRHIFRALSALIVIPLTLTLLAGCRDKTTGSGPHITVKLLTDQESIAPGSSFTLGVHFQPEPGWHIYWKNPGDSGLAPRFGWEGSSGISVKNALWPYPEKIEVGTLVNYGYGDVLIPFPATFSQGEPGEKNATVMLSLQWLVCKDECLPGETQLELNIPISTSAGLPSPHERLFATTLKNIPTPLDRVSLAVEEQQDQIILALIPLESRFFPSTIRFFPEDPRVIANAAPQEATLEGGALRITLQRDPTRRDPISRVRGVLYSPQGWSETGEPKAIEIDSTPGDEPPLQATNAQARTTGGVAGNQDNDVGFLAALILAFLGGLLLNIMPCVFPVLSIKLLSFIEQSGHERQKIKRHGLAFAAGVISSFWIFAITLLALRAAGEQVGWGFQLQSPTFVVAMIFVFLSLGFMLLSDLTIGTTLQQLAGRAKISTTYAGSFLNGALATAVATPCTGPFMGSALAATLTLPAALSLMVFTMLGLGMSAPYIAIAYKPELLKRLPRPGAWMEIFKQAMAFPLFATVVWLVRVFARQMGLEAQGLTLLTDLLWGLLFVSVAFWILIRSQKLSAGRRKRVVTVIAWATLALGLLIGFPSTSEIEGSRSRACLASGDSNAEPDQYGLIWEPYSDVRLAKLLSEGRSVYLDFTAEWCITCQVNHRVVFSSSEVRGFIAQKNVALMRGDWTAKSPAITAALRRYGRNGVPLNVIIKNGQESAAVVLPNLLTPATVLAELQKL